MVILPLVKKKRETLSHKHTHTCKVNHKLKKHYMWRVKIRWKTLG